MTRVPTVSVPRSDGLAAFRPLAIWLLQRLSVHARILLRHRTVNRRAARPPNLPDHLRSDVGLAVRHEPKRYTDYL